ncbi:FAD/NAD(P)-binding domain-containing protein [Aspergillus japonicus CBS 114.51]|uniref:FAD/NAD(P)-binding domain-containing protein n=1 Tax=Aspergillus japonicus CBS 114.51 TaxID=1448312 RepID=A0A8T8WQU6_ASPJA|nr:FAD/NAD(P)-binding domain-containing protein [Aspergillus japonicus CBS 114.51]RAH78033.1 FAD/NAD(P)-binding domain-containing protein [Aspergillus japonicus CBS 114.51]
MPDASSRKIIVVLGGSYGGVSTAHYLLKHVIPKQPTPDLYQIILVSSSFQAMCRQACPRALISDEYFDQKKLFVDIRSMFAHYPEGSFRFIHGTATAVTHTERSVSIAMSSGGTHETIAYHVLVIATGASTPSPALGLNQDAVHLRSSWSAIRQTLPHVKTIVIAGGGPAGVETAGELGEHLNGRHRGGWMSFGRSPNQPPNVHITLVTSGFRLLPALRPALAIKAERLLADVGVSVIKNARVQSVHPENAGPDAVAATVTLEDGRTLPADLYIPATGTKPNTGFLDPSLVAADGRVETNSTLRVRNAGDRVYAIGDAASYAARPSVHGILQAVPILCANIRRDLLLEGGGVGDGDGDSVFKEDTRETQIVPIGTARGVGAMMGYKLPGFLVWLFKGRDYFLWTTKKIWSGEQWG